MGSTTSTSQRHVVVWWDPYMGVEGSPERRLCDEVRDRLDLIVVEDQEAAMLAAKANADRLAVFIAKAGSAGQPSGLSLLQQAKTEFGRHIFTILFSHTLSVNPHARLEAAAAGVDMVSHVLKDIRVAVERATMMPVVAERLADPAKHPYTCPICGLVALDSLSLWHHMPLFHTPEKKSRNGHACPICKSRSGTIVVHVHDEHAPPGEHVDESRSGIPLYSFGLVVVRRRKDAKFLVVQEYGRQGYWLPGGGIDAGEMPTTAAIRECLEEAGVRIKLTGLLRVEMSPGRRGTRMRFIFYGEPEDENDCEAKTLPDFESVGACWVSAEEILSGTLQLRGDEPLQWFEYVANGGPIHPIDIVTFEGDEPPGAYKSSVA